MRAHEMGRQRFPMQIAEELVARLRSLITDSSCAFECACKVEWLQSGGPIL